MSQSKIAQVAQILDNAAHTAQEVDQFAPGHFTLPEAYEIQRASIDHRVQRGETLTSIAQKFQCDTGQLAKRNGLSGLSMGMSSDFEVAIAAGATHVRVGSAIFGARG